MSYRRDIETLSARQLFEVGYEHLIDSQQTRATFRDRADSAHHAALYLAAAQSAALLDLVEAQRAANTIAAYPVDRGALETAEEYAAGRAAVRDALGFNGRRQ